MALDATYKGACRLHGVNPSKEIQGRIAELLVEGKPLEKIILAGPEWEGEAVAAVVECLPGYPLTRNLCCWGCTIGDTARARSAAAAAHRLPSSVYAAAAPSRPSLY